MNSKKDKIIKKANEQSIYALYRTDTEYDRKHGKKFVALSKSLIMNENFIKLPSGSKVLYLYMMAWAKGKQDFEFPYNLAVQIGLCSNSTFKSNKDKLIKYGFIEEIANGKFQFNKNKYVFSSEWKKIDITNEKRNSNLPILNKSKRVK